MSYRVVFSTQAKKALKKLDRYVYATIVAWIRCNLEGCSNPRLHGKGLTANRSGQWRYRIGDYRLIADIQDDVVVILIVTVGHRRDVYDYPPARAGAFLLPSPHLLSVYATPPLGASFLLSRSNL